MTDPTMRRLGVLGGTFDPIHVGHLIAASEARYRFDLDLVLFVPTGQPWQKDAYSNAEHRLAMTMLGTGASRRFAVSRIEIDRQGPTYTADTMSSLRDFYGDQAQLFFIAGADAATKLGTWNGVERLAETTEVIAVTRSGHDLAGLEADPGWPVVHVLEMPDVAVSATDIRERVGDGRPIDFLTPAEVVDYISANHLYAGGDRIG
jgi:nicotinate-nucleotide adenylyltransferase